MAIPTHVRSPRIQRAKAENFNRPFSPSVRNSPRGRQAQARTAERARGKNKSTGDMDASSWWSVGRGGRNPRGRGPSRGYGRGRGDGSGGGRGRGDGGKRGDGRGQGRGRGANWNYQGGDENQNSSNQQQQQQYNPAANKTNQFERFISTGLQRCPPHKLPDLIQSAGTLWADCWRKAAELPIPQLRVVLSALARLPFSSSIEPPPIRDVSHGVFSLVSELTSGATQQWASVDLSEAKLEVVELVEKLFEVSLWYHCKFAFRFAANRLCVCLLLLL